MYDLANYYYENKLGSLYEDGFETTANTFEYLMDAGFSKKELYSIIDKLEPKETLHQKDLPEWLWDNSLLKKDTFYYSSLIQIVSPFHKKFSIEMKIKFTMDDVINYYYDRTHQILRDKARDIGTINFLLNKYSNLKFMEPIDFILSLIGYAANSTDCSLLNLLQIDNMYGAEAYVFFEAKALQAESEHVNKIIYR